MGSGRMWRRVHAAMLIITTMMRNIPCIVSGDKRIPFGCKSLIVATKSRSRDTISLTEHALLMLSRCNCAKMALLCLGERDVRGMRACRWFVGGQGKTRQDTCLQKKLRMVLRLSSGNAKLRGADGAASSMLSS